MQILNVLPLLDRPIAYHRIFAEIGGSVTAGVFLSQVVYWSQRANDPDGWFWKTQKEWQEETYLKRSEQEIARRELRAAGILEEKKKGVPAKLYFRLNAETLNQRLLSSVCQNAASKHAEMLHAPSKDAKKPQPWVKSKKAVETLDSNEFQSDSVQAHKDAESSILYLTETTSETTSEISNLIKDPLYPPEGDVSVENFFLEMPSDLEIEVLKTATLEFSASEVAEAELGGCFRGEDSPRNTPSKPRPHLSSTLATLEKTNVPPPRENGSQIIKTAADVKPAIAAHRESAKTSKRTGAITVDRAAQHKPEAAEAWWALFRAQAHHADCKPGSKSEAIAAWDLLHKIEPEDTRATLYERIIQGTEAYWEREAARQNPNCKHGVRFLEKRDWQEALQWAEVKVETKVNSAQRFASFLTCWNQDRPMTWPTADDSDLGHKSTARLEELANSCQNSLERFQKALLFCKRDRHWGLERSQTLEEFLYSGQINNFYKKQVHAESIGMDKMVAPDRKAVEAAAAKEAFRQDAVARLFENYRKGEISKADFRTCLPGYGVDPDSVPEAC